MKNGSSILSTVAGVVVLTAGAAWAADQERTQTKTQSQMPTRMQTDDTEQIYGSQIMTEQERAEHRAEMRTAKTPEEREQIRNEHYKQMSARAKERGITLPEDPPMAGRDDAWAGAGGGGGR